MLQLHCVKVYRSALQCSALYTAVYSAPAILSASQWAHYCIQTWDWEGSLHAPSSADFIIMTMNNHGNDMVWCHMILQDMIWWCWRNDKREKLRLFACPFFISVTVSLFIKQKERWWHCLLLQRISSSSEYKDDGNDMGDFDEYFDDDEGDDGDDNDAKVLRFQSSIIRLGHVLWSPTKITQTRRAGEGDNHTVRRSQDPVWSSCDYNSRPHVIPACDYDATAANMRSQ